MSETESLRNMVLTFRVSELQMLLGFAGRNKTGRKSELQARAIELLRLRSTPVQMKIKELYKTIQQGQVNVLPVQQNQTPIQQPSKEIPPTTNGNSNSNNMQQQQRNMYQPGGFPVQAQDNRQQQPRGSNMYASNMYHNYQPKTTTSVSNFPIHPDVRLKRLPFYDILAELLKPSTLVPNNNSRVPQDTSFVFHLTPQQASDIACSRNITGNKIEFEVQVQMRFCMSETSCEQEDFFPSGISVKVNNKICNLPNPIPTNKPGVEPKRPPRPVNITPLVQLSPTVANQIGVQWNVDLARNFVIAVYMVRKLTSSELLQRLKTRGARHSDFTRGLIQEKLAEDADCEIATTSLRVSLMCPLGKMRMTTPCRASTCSHLQCFDASIYIQMNEKKPTWMCPVCNKPALYDNLGIDGYFQQVLLSDKLLTDSSEIQLHQDGSWSTFVTKKESHDLLSPMVEGASSNNKQSMKVETISDDLEVLPLPPVSKKMEDPKVEVIGNTTTIQTPPPVKDPTTNDVVDLTLSDSDDETVSDSNTDSVMKPDSTHSTTNANSEVTTSGMEMGSVSSSGYMSPSIITLDSPSPPPTVPSPPITSSIPQHTVTPYPPRTFVPNVAPTYLELDSDNSISPQSVNNNTNNTVYHY